MKIIFCKDSKYLCEKSKILCKEKKVLREKSKVLVEDIEYGIVNRLVGTKHYYSFCNEQGTRVYRNLHLLTQNTFRMTEQRFGYECKGGNDDFITDHQGSREVTGKWFVLHYQPNQIFLQGKCCYSDCYGKKCVENRTLFFDVSGEHVKANPIEYVVEPKYHRQRIYDRKMNKILMVKNRNLNKVEKWSKCKQTKHII